MINTNQPLHTDDCYTFGTIRFISNDRQRVKVKLENGSSAECQNAGFSVGDEVCLHLNATKTKVINITQREVAEYLMAKSKDPLLAAASQSPPPDIIPEFEGVEIREGEPADFLSIEEELADAEPIQCQEIRIDDGQEPSYRQDDAFRPNRDRNQY